MRLFIGRRTALRITALVLVAFGLGAIARADPSLTPTEQYLVLRRLNPPTAGLNLHSLADSPGRFRGKTMELQGRLAVLAPRNDGVGLILQTDSGQFVPLTMSAKPDWVSVNDQLRVLVVVPDDESASSPTVQLGVPDLQVVAVTSATDISAAEYRWQQDAQQHANARSREDRALNAANVVMSGASAAASHSSGTRPRMNIGLASRGGAIRSGALFKYLSPAAKSTYPAYMSFVRQWNPRLTDSQADAIAASILEYSERFEVDPRLVVSMVIAESDFHPGETSNKGAMGLAQLMPDEVHSLGLTNPYDPVQNIAGAVYLLRGRLDKYSGGASLTMQHIILALASYNAGMGAVKKYGGVPPYRETQNYVKKIERIYRQLCSGSPAAQ